MTLVAAVSPYQMPLMIGDLLITSEKTGYEVEQFPTLGDLFFIKKYPDEFKYISGFSQKIAMISDNMAVGWSGRYDAAWRSIGLVRTFPWSEKPSCDEVIQCMQSLSYEDQMNIGLVFFCRFSDDWFGFRPVFRYTEHNLPVFGRSFLMGRGSRSFSNFSQGLSDIPVRGIDPPFGESVAVTVSAAMHLLAQEMIDFGGLLSGFGGAFELVRISPRLHLEKLDDMSFCFWTLKAKRNGLDLIPSGVIIRMKYFNDIAMIRRISLMRRSYRTNCIGVGPMGREVSEEEMVEIRNVNLDDFFDQEVTCDCHYVLFPEASKALPFVNLTQNGEALKLTMVDENTVQLSFRRKEFGLLAERVFAFYRKVRQS